MPTIHKAPNTHTYCTHLTWIETTGWQFSPLTGSIRGQSAAGPHAVQPQRDTLDYRETARHTIEEGDHGERSRMKKTAGERKGPRIG